MRCLRSMLLGLGHMTVQGAKGLCAQVPGSFTAIKPALAGESGKTTPLLRSNKACWDAVLRGRCRPVFLSLMRSTFKTEIVNCR